MPSFSHGSRGRIYVNGYDLSPYFKEVSTAGELDTADATALADTHHKFLTGLASAKLSGEGMHDDSAGAIVPVLTAAESDTATEVVHWINQDVIGRSGYGMQGVETTFNVNTPVDDVAAVSFEAESNTGFERVVSLRPKSASDTSGTANSASVDNAVGTNAGAAGYLHLFSNGGGTVTCKVQHSTDDSAWTDLLTFTDVAGTVPTSQRVETSGTVRRYLRAQIIKTGAGAVTASISASRTPWL